MIHDPSTPGGSDRPPESDRRAGSAHPEGSGHPEDGEPERLLEQPRMAQAQKGSRPFSTRSAARSSGSWGAELERKIMSALTLGHWDVEQHPHADRVKVDFIVRRNIRRLQMPRPILIQVTTWLDNSKKWLDFLETARQHFGDNNFFLYIECEITNNRGRKQLCFDELPVMTAIGNIASFFDKVSDHNIFRLRMAEAGNSFRRVSDPEQEFASERRSPVVTRADSPHRYPRPGASMDGVPQSSFKRGHATQEVGQYHSQRSDTRHDGRLTAWKSVPEEEYKDYGWIEAADGSRYNAYWKAFADLSSVERIRELTDKDPGGGPWVDLNMPVRFRVLPPQVGGKHPRAVDIELLNE